MTAARRGSLRAPRSAPSATDASGDKPAARYVDPSKDEGGIQPTRARAEGQHDLFGGIQALPEKKDRRTEAEKQATAGQKSMFGATLGDATPTAKEAAAPADVDIAAIHEKHRQAILAENPDVRAFLTHADAHNDALPKGQFQDRIDTQAHEQWVGHEAKARLTPEQRTAGHITDRMAARFPKPATPAIRASR